MFNFLSNEILEMIQEDLCYDDLKNLFFACQLNKSMQPILPCLFFLGERKKITQDLCTYLFDHCLETVIYKGEDAYLELVEKANSGKRKRAVHYQVPRIHLVNTIKNLRNQLEIFREDRFDIPNGCRCYRRRQELDSRVQTSNLLRSLAKKDLSILTRLDLPSQVIVDAIRDTIKHQDVTVLESLDFLDEHQRKTIRYDLMVNRKL